MPRFKNIPVAGLRRSALFEGVSSDKGGRLATAIRRSPYTVLEAATALNLSTHTIRAWISRRKIDYVRLGKSIRIPASEVEQLLAEGLVPARPGKLA